MTQQVTLSELSIALDAQLIGDPSHLISGVNTLEEATESDASFLANSRYAEAMRKSLAGVICIDQSTPPIEGKNFLICKDPSSAIQKIAELFIPQEDSGFQGIHPTAVIHKTAQVHESASIGPYAVIDRNVKIGPRTKIGPHVSIGSSVEIGADCILYPHTTVRERCKLADRVILQPGSVVGSCGFGYTMDEKGRHVKLEQLGIVILEEDVEIGANSTIDRARFKETVIKKGTKIDNLVQIAHNVEIGEHNIIAAQTGIAGSSKTGKYVMMGGQTGILGHVRIEDRVQIATRSGVSKSLKTGKYRGSPAIDFYEYQRQEVHVRKLEEYIERLKKLEKKLQ